MSQKLTGNERWLLGKIKAGRPAVFPTETVIRSTVVRDYILGLASEDQNNWQASGPYVLHNAVFHEHFDLSDGRLAGGGSLGAIEFVKCSFHSGFCADGADLERLAFRQCAFVAAERAESPTSSEATPLQQLHTPGDAPPIAGELSFQRRDIKNRISLRNCRIRTELRLEHLAPNDREAGILLVDGFAAVIGTNVVIRHTILRAPQCETSTTDPEPRYALDLSTAKIGSDVRLMPCVRLEGGLTMRDALVEGTFWGSGLKLSDGETAETRKAIQQSGASPRAALRLDTATFKGSVTFGTDESSLLQKAIRFQSEKANAKALATVDLWSFIEPFRFSIEGNAILRNGTINGDLDLSQGMINGLLQMQGLMVRGDMTANPNIDAEIKRILTLAPRISAMFPLEVNGSVWLNNAQVDGEVSLEAVVEKALYASGAEFNGFVTLAGSVPEFEANGMRTAKDFTLAFRGLSETSMQGAWIGGVLDLKPAEFSKTKKLTLSKCEVQQAMDFAEPLLPPKAVRRHSLSCYRGVTLTEVLFVGDEAAIAAFLTFDRPSDVTVRAPEITVNRNRTFLPILLNGRSEPLDTLNKGSATVATDNGSREETIKINCPLELRTEVQAREYLKLFCAYVWGEEGLFSIISDPRDLGTADYDPEILKISFIETTNDEGKPAWKAKAYERYSYEPYPDVFYSNVFTATFCIFKDTGYVEVKDYELFNRYPDEKRIPRSPYRTVPKDDKTYRSDFLGPEKFSEDADDLDQFKRDATGWQTLLGQSFAGMSVVMNGASCRLLNDNTAFLWKRIKKLEIESFDYKEVSIPKDRVMNELNPRLDMVRNSLGLKRPETKTRSRIYFSLTIVSSLVLLIVIFLLYRAYPLTTTLFGLLLSIAVFLTARSRRRQASNFRTEPYTHLAKVLRERGDDGAAQEVEAEKIWQAAVHRAKSTSWGKLVRIFWWRPYRVMFRYGLSPLRAALSVFIIWVLGSFVVSELSQHQMLEAAITKVALAAQASPGRKPTMIVLQGMPGVKPDVPCGDEIQPPLYAFELLTPILNLHQEGRCGLRDDPDATVFNRQWPSLAFLSRGWFWEYAKALYMLLGSVISSLAVLTFSGIARRWEQ